MCVYPLICLSLPVSVSITHFICIHLFTYFTLQYQEFSISISHLRFLHYITVSPFVYSLSVSVCRVLPPLFTFLRLDVLPYLSVCLRRCVSVFQLIFLAYLWAILFLCPSVHVPKRICLFMYPFFRLCLPLSVNVCFFSCFYIYFFVISCRTCLSACVYLSVCVGLS